MDGDAGYPTDGDIALDDKGTPDDPTDDEIIYTPDMDFNGTDEFTYEICDADGDCDEATVTVTIESVDDVPVAVDDASTTDEDTPVAIDVTDNDDFGGDGPSTGTITVPMDGDAGYPTDGDIALDDKGTPDDPTDDEIIYTPDMDFNGTDEFTYEICDADGDCDEATVTVTIESVDDVPVAVDDASTTDEDTPVAIDVTDNDDFGGDGPSTGTITVPMDGDAGYPTDGDIALDDKGTPDDPTDDEIIYTPDMDFNGTDEFTYEICDADGDCDEATVTVTIESVDDVPVAVDDASTTDEDTPVAIDVNR